MRRRTAVLWGLGLGIAGMYAATYLPAALARPGKKPRFGIYYFAHRGACKGPFLENTLPAIAECIRRGYGMELDVRVTKDNVPVLFHDYRLQKKCGDPRRVCDCTLEEIRSMRLCGTEETIPTLEEALRLVDGQVPLLLDMKPFSQTKRLYRPLCRILKGYAGPYRILSWSYPCKWWFWKNFPQAPRVWFRMGKRAFPRKQEERHG